MAEVENNLIQYVNDFFESLELYDDYTNEHNYKDLLHASIIRFLEFENTYTAYEIYENFFMIYQITDEDKSEERINPSNQFSQSNALLKLVNMMKDYEDNTGDLIEKQRDHFIHSVNVFILGLAIYSQNTRYQEEFEDYIFRTPYKKYYKIDGELSREEFLYRWGIASLFHDIGYPVEIIGKQLAKFVNDGSHSISNRYNVDTAINFKNFYELNSIVKIDPCFPNLYRRDYPEANFINLYKPTDILAHQIFTDLFVEDVIDVQKNFHKLGGNLKKLIRHLGNFVDYMAENDFIDHGYFSAIFVLNSYAALMQNYYYDDEEKYAYFFYPVVNSATSILLHNYYRGTLNKYESKTNLFNLDRLEPNQNPLAYMLILCDELQEWNRRPIGIKDKKKNHVNDLNIQISNNKLSVEYILKNSSLGLGFTHDKKTLINKLLDVESIFENGLAVDVKTDLDSEIPLAEIIISDSETPNILLRHIEEIARANHRRYNEIEVEKGNPDVAYEDLDASKKLSSVRLAKSYPHKLHLIGCEIVPISDPRPEHKLTPGEVDYLAVIEHEDWCEEQRNTGWVSPKYALKNELITEEIYNDLMKANEEGFTSNVDNKYKDEEKGIYVHANLIPFDELNEDSQEKDKRPIREIPLILKGVENNPLKIVQNNIRRLSIQIHENYRQFSEEEVPKFDDLPFETKYSNFKQAYLISRLLAQIDYKIVPIDAPGEAVTKFEPKEIDYLAKNEHNAWYLRRLNQGYVYGDERDGMKNPKLKPWDELKPNDKKLNKMTFRKLPKTCHDVDLKIIRI